MDAPDILANFVLNQHVPIHDVLEGAEQRFVIFFDEDGREIPFDVVAQASPMERQGEREFFSPEPGLGHYANVRLAGSGASMNGASTRYVFAAPDWSATVHVTEPSTGGDPDAIVEAFDVTEGARRFVMGLHNGS